MRRPGVHVYWCSLALLVAIGVGCTNDPFDPSTVANSPPVVRFFVSPGDSGDSLNPTSYNHRTFHWSGSDQDGVVVAYYVSVRVDPELPAPWTETTRTDTTMTFLPDTEGVADAVFYLVCRDNAGALSDTVRQYVPMRNSPPAIGFQADYEPFANLQREIRPGEAGAPADTLYWNWGAMNFRCLAYDADGSDTMDDFFRYTVAETAPECVGTDPRVCWVEGAFLTSGEFREFEIDLADLPPGVRTLTISVGDESGSASTFTYSWEVRLPRGPVLLVTDNYGSLTSELYRPFLDDHLGPEGYDRYEFWYGYPDDPGLLLVALRQYSVVMWLSGSTSSNLERAAATGGALQQYVTGAAGYPAGRLWMVSRTLTGSSSGLPNSFRVNVLGVAVLASPVADLVPVNAALGAVAVSPVSTLPPLTLASLSARGVGLGLVAGSEVLYRFEPCNRCFGIRPPFDPIIAYRRPLRANAALARVVGISFDLEFMEREPVLEALSEILANELGVPPR
jgi:hypothetical protein